MKNFGTIYTNNFALLKACLLWLLLTFLLKLKNYKIDSDLNAYFHIFIRFLYSNYFMQIIWIFVY